MKPRNLAACSVAVLLALAGSALAQAALIGAKNITTNTRILAAVLCLLGAFPGRVGAASTTLPATTAPATGPASAAPVLRGLNISDAGYFAEMEIPNPDGSTSRVLLKNGDVLEWNHTRILDIAPGRIRVSRPVPPEGGEPWLDIKIGYNIEGQRIPPKDSKPEPAPPPLNPALLPLRTDALFAKCLATTGTDYTEAKAVLVSRPEEAAAVAKKVLDNKDAPWQDRVFAQALAEEIADPKAYATARMELIRVARIRWQISESSSPQGGYPSGGGPPAAYQRSSDNLYEVLAKYPGLKGEMVLKSTADFVFPLAAEIASQSSRRLLEKWKADPNPSYAMPRAYTPEEYMKAAKPSEPAQMLFFARSEAAFACAKAPNADTQSLLRSLDPKEYASVLAECERILQEAATKPATTIQPATATNPAK